MRCRAANFRGTPHLQRHRPSPFCKTPTGTAGVVPQVELRRRRQRLESATGEVVGQWHSLLASHRLASRRCWHHARTMPAGTGILGCCSERWSGTTGSVRCWCLCVSETPTPPESRNLNILRQALPGALCHDVSSWFRKTGSFGYKRRGMGRGERRVHDCKDSDESTGRIFCTLHF